MKASRNHLLISLGIGLLALVLRLLAINSRPLWYDEAIAVLVAEKGPALILQSVLSPEGGVAANVHPPTYFSALWAWMKVFGDSPLAVRSLSVLISMGTLVLVYYLARMVFDDRSALVAIGLFAFSPFQIHYGQENRMYALLAFFLIGATYFLWWGMQTRRLAWWLLFGLFAALAQYTHNLAAFYLVPLALIPLLRRDWRSVRAVILSGLGALVLYLPWLIRIPEQLARVGRSYWTTPPSPARFLTTLLSYVTNLPLPDTWLPIGLFVTLVVVIIGGWQTLRVWRSRPNGVREAAWMAYLAFVPPILLFLISQWQPVYIERALLPSGVAFLLWVAWVISRSKLPQVMSVLISALLLLGMGMGVYQHVTYRGFPYAPFDELDAYLAQNLASSDVILHSNKLTMLPAVYYNRDLPQRYLGDPVGSGADTLSLPTQQVLGLLAYPDPASAVGEADRVWFIMFSRAIQECQELGERTHPHLTWLNEHYELARVETWNDVDLYVYQR